MKCKRNININVSENKNKRLNEAHAHATKYANTSVEIIKTANAQFCLSYTLKIFISKL